MSPNLALRRVRSDELDAVRTLVEQVVAERYPEIVARHGAPHFAPESWGHATVAVLASVLVGVGRVFENRVTDLWVRAGHRGEGVGASLLQVLEADLRRAGYERAHLRCGADNTDARRFYVREGWTEVRAFPHERFGHPMVELTKRLD